MPSFFIIAFIWRGLIFPGSIFLTTLPYSYRYSIIKCKHLRARNDCCAAGNEPIFACNNHHVIARADCRVCCDNVFCKRILALCHELCNIVPDDHAVRRGRKERLERVLPLRCRASACRPMPGRLRAARRSKPIWRIRPVVEKMNVQPSGKSPVPPARRTGNQR